MDIVRIIEKRSQAVPVTPIPVDMIDPSPFQARQHFSIESLQSLAESIEAKGLLNAVLIRARNERYELIAGERRWRAAKDHLKLLYIDGKILECSDDEAADLCAAENFQREDLRPSEKARQIKNLEERGKSPKEIAIVVGLTTTKVQELLKLAALPLVVQEMYDERALKMTTVPVLAGLAETKDQVRAAEMAKTGKLTRIQLESRTDHLPKRVAPTKRHAPPVESAPLQQINRGCINLEHELRNFSPSHLSPRERESMLKLLGNLMNACQALRQSMLRE